MPVPKKRHSKSKVGRRRANLGLKKVKLMVCEECKAPIRPHRACANCGKYGKRKV
ncbi:MAG: 50S ribosomal protein L32 [Candidatus Harrisonbacteria bacterium CG10_big_fil_rev_8_21_14_0_10_44_23]|uniref:Large ribosomal subunit protein bL32 n=1 Tax=Candidatus Harrisonbacteria bacterium CG10_big_fil_rev_8_21_14_0_10_44_23 TaxID=1974585 RepID=A0A2H0UPU7_9BACT|nr:MAG: 50S ribosomal protein L32 [Candidatus Harrisonbacteria bacterium CG10_big_fil_rev_8_21_14_0_10_44_23]